MTAHMSVNPLQCEDDLSSEAHGPVFQGGARDQINSKI